MTFNEQTLKQDLEAELKSALTFVIGDSMCAVEFSDPVAAQAKSKLIARYSIDGIFSTSTLDGSIHADFAVMNGTANIGSLQVTFGDRDQSSVTFHEPNAFIGALQNAYDNYQTWLRKPTHRLDIKVLLQEALSELEQGNQQAVKEKLDKALESI